MVLHLGFDAPEPSTPLSFIQEIINRVRRFRYDMQRNPRTWLLGYVALTGTAIVVGTAVAGGAAGAIAAAPKKDVRKYDSQDWGTVGKGFVRGASGKRA